MRIFLRALLALTTLAAAGVLAILLHGHALIHSPAPNPVPALRVAPDSALAARGAHLSAIVCSSCHSSADPGVLEGGGEDFTRIPGGPDLGTLYAPNLTPGGPVGLMSDGELARAIREGVGHDGRPLLVMPSAGLRHLSDRDLAAVIAYLRRQPATARRVPARHLNLLGYAVLGAHVFPVSLQRPVEGPVADPPAGATPEHGAYLTSICDCGTCHGPDLRGGRKGQLPPLGPDLVAFAKRESLPVFSAALRQGINPAGGALDPRVMPWMVYANLDDAEAEAIWRSLRGRP